MYLALPLLFTMAMLKIASLNCQGQTGITPAKALFINDLVKRNKYDILNLQETMINEDTFELCDEIIRNYNVITNNTTNFYGTTCLIKNYYNIRDLRRDAEGRIIIFDIEDITYVNIYPKAGTDANSRNNRENMFASILPNMLRYHKDHLIIAGDWNWFVHGFQPAL